MRIAVIDCGTNTFHLIIAEINEARGVKKIHKETLAVKLGEGAFAAGRITPAAMQRGIEAMQRFSEQAQRHKAEKTFAFATAAVRSAANGMEFIGRVKEESGIEIKLISGEEEAELIYYGVRQAVTMTEKVSLIMDIGGGSTEFIACNQEKIFGRFSFQLGASLLLQKFRPSDPVAGSEISTMENFFDETLHPLWMFLKAIPKADSLIGSSGSFDTFAQLAGWQFHNEDVLRGKTEYAISMDEYFKIHDVLMHSTRSERAALKGMVPLRVDMIVVASLLLNFVLKKTGIHRITWSDYALKEGMLSRVVQGLQPGFPG